MATSDFQLSAPPEDPQQLELWLQHAAGMILFQDVRQYALEQMAPDLTAEAAAAARKAIDDALYGLMMVLDGVTGVLENDALQVNLRTTAELLDKENEDLVASLDLSDGDGMCMGYHGWVENDFGEIPPATPDTNPEDDDDD